MAFKDKAKEAEYKRAYRLAHVVEKTISDKAWRLAHREELKAYNITYQPAYRVRTKEHRAAYLKAYRAAHRVEVKAYRDAYYAAHRAEIFARNTAYVAKRMRTDPLFRFRESIRRFIKGSFSRRGFSKGSRTHRILGCTYGEFRAWIRSKFQPGMTFENYGRWHIDHKVPLSTAKTEKDVVRLCHHTNLQPLWEMDNKRKGARTCWPADTGR